LFSIRSIGNVSLAVRIAVLEPASRNLVGSEHVIVEALKRGVITPVIVMLFTSVVSVLRGPFSSTRLVRIVPVHVRIGVLVSVISRVVVVVVSVVVVVVVTLVFVSLFVVVGRVPPVVILFVRLGLLVVVMLRTGRLGTLVVMSRWRGRWRLVVRSVAGMLVVRAGRRGRLRVRSGWRRPVWWSVLRSGVTRRGTVWSVGTSVSSVIVVGRSRIVVFHPALVVRWRSHRRRSSTRYTTWRSHRSERGRREHGTRQFFCYNTAQMSEIVNRPKITVTNVKQ